MAIVRGLAFKINAGVGRCWIYELAWDEQAGLTDTGRVLAWCDQPPVTTLHGSGICAEHCPLFLERRSSN
jgi:hypothetical protein